jgi:methionyl-tRNA synthetase
MPEKATQLLDGLGVKPERRTIEFARSDTDLAYGTGPVLESKHPDAFASLFPPVAGIELPDAEVVAGMEGPKNRLGRVVAALAQEAQKAQEAETKETETKETEAKETQTKE